LLLGEGGVSDAAALLAARAENVSGVVPTVHARDMCGAVPPGSVVSEHGVVMCRAAELDHVCIPSVRHALPPPLPDPVCLLPAQDRTDIINNTLFASLAMFARNHVEAMAPVRSKRDCGAPTPLSMPIPAVGPPAPWYGECPCVAVGHVSARDET
jgi:hypothetical protein